MSPSAPPHTVSVIIPTKDRPDLIGEAVESALTQSRRPDEVVIVDDASTASYADAVQRLKATWGEDVIAYHRLDAPHGAAAARNEGAARARGNVLMFLDDDDAWLPEKVENQLRVLDAHPDARLVYSGILVVDEDGRTLDYSTPAHEGHFLPTLLTSNVIGSTSCVALPRDAFEAVGGFDPEMPALQDLDLYVRVAKTGPIHADRALTVKHVTHSHASRQITADPAKGRRALERLLEKHADAFAALPDAERRRALAGMYRQTAEKYAQQGQAARRGLAWKSFRLDPTLDAVVIALPLPLYRLARAIMRARRKRRMSA